LTFLFGGLDISKKYLVPPSKHFSPGLRHNFWSNLNSPPPSNAFRKQKNILEDLFNSVLSQFKKYHHPGNLKFNCLVNFRSLKLRILMEKLLSISLQLNISQNTLGCYGLMNLGNFIY